MVKIVTGTCNNCNITYVITLEEPLVCPGCQDVFAEITVTDSELTKEECRYT